MTIFATVIFNAYKMNSLAAAAAVKKIVAAESTNDIHDIGRLTAMGNSSFFWPNPQNIFAVILSS